MVNVQPPWQYINLNALTCRLIRSEQTADERAFF